MNKNDGVNEWLELAEAADILGVHFTTLRRWADAGKVPHVRSVSGRRRFNRAVLEKMAQDPQQQASQPIDTTPLEVKTLDRARQNTRGLNRQPGGWVEHLNEEQRMAFRYGGQRLLGLLMQFTSRDDGGEPFVNEGKHMAQDYGDLCYRSGMSVVDLVQAFLFFRRNIVESLYATTSLVSQRDPEGQRLFERVNEFFDLFLLTMIDHFIALKDQQDGSSSGSQTRNT